MSSVTLNPGMMSSDRPDWNTPPEFLNIVRRIGPIGLDPCSNAASLVGAVTSWTEADDGLPRAWTGHGLVYVNPPYGRVIPAWSAKMRQEGAKGAEIVTLIPARVDTAWWHDDIITADAICLIRRRLKFLGAPSSAPFPSAVAYWGPRLDRFIAAFGAHGWIVRTLAKAEPTPLPLFAPWPPA